VTGALVRNVRPLDLDELLDHFTLDPDELKLLRNKTGATRLGFALLLKYPARKGRFPHGRSDLADNAISTSPGRSGVPPEELVFYFWAGRTIKGHRAEIRRHLRFRECTVGDADKLTGWLAEHVAQYERRADRSGGGTTRDTESSG
jgi:hypothetical protein